MMEPDAAAALPSRLSPELGPGPELGQELGPGPELGQELGPPEPDPFDVFGPAASLSAEDEPQQEGEVRESSPHDSEADAGEEREGEENQMSREDQFAHFREMLLLRGYRPKLDADGEPRSAVLSSFDIDGIAEYLQRNDCRNVVVMAGAGISVSAGIPDFRSPGTGLYDNLQKYDLPSPQSVFDLDFFRERPEAFYLLARELWPDNYCPTPVHYFIRLLHDKGMLLRCFTQNIDSLEAATGLPKEKIVAAHGNFDSAHCIDTGEAVPVEQLRAAIQAGKEGPGGWLELAELYGGLVKPDIVFFGEQASLAGPAYPPSLPERFFQLMQEDFPECDLLIVTGTSLKVQPFASLVGRVGINVPRLLVNRERVGENEPMLEMLGLVSPGALNFEEGQYRDAEFLGDCDAGIAELVRRLGWQADLDALMATGARPAPQPAPDSEARPTPASPGSPAPKRQNMQSRASPPLQPFLPPQPTSPMVSPPAEHELQVSASFDSFATEGAAQELAGETIDAQGQGLVE